MTASSTPSPLRWALLGAFAVLVATTQVLWLSFAPVADRAATTLGVGADAVGDLAVVNPVLFVVVALPAGRLVDRSLPRGLAVGAVLTAAGALLRLVDAPSYGWCLAGQVVASLAQPFVLTATTALAAQCFEPRRRPLAIAVGSAAQFVGVLAAALTGPVLVEGGLERLLVLHAVLATVAAAGVLVLVPARSLRRADAGDGAGPGTGPAPAASLRGVLADPVVRGLAVLLFVGVGLFNALATWLDTLLPVADGPDLAGRLIALTTVCGVVGAAVLPTWAARRGRRRDVLVAASATSAVVLALLSQVLAVPVVVLALAVEGFVLLAALPVALEWVEEHLGADRAGAGGAVLLLAGNLGAVLLVLLVQPVVDRPGLAFAALAVVAVPGVLVARRLPAPRLPVVEAA